MNNQTSQNKGSEPFLFHPELGFQIIIFNERTYRAAKIFWDDIEDLWDYRIAHEKFITSELPGVYHEAG